MGQNASIPTYKWARNDGLDSCGFNAIAGGHPINYAYSPLREVAVRCIQD